MVAEHVHHPRWGAHAQRIMDGSMWKPPRAGGHDDKAHPPIHPTRYSAGEPDWSHGKLWNDDWFSRKRGLQVLQLALPLVS